MSFPTMITPSRRGSPGPDSMFGSAQKRPRFEDGAPSDTSLAGLKVCGLAPREFRDLSAGGSSAGGVGSLGGSVDAAGWALASGARGEICVWELCIASRSEAPKEPRKVYSFR